MKYVSFILLAIVDTKDCCLIFYEDESGRVVPKGLNIHMNYYYYTTSTKSFIRIYILI